MQNQNETNACPACGGGPVTWKCTCEPMWTGYAADAPGMAEPVAEVRYSKDLAYAQWLIDAPPAGTKLFGAPQPVAQMERALTEPDRAHVNTAMDVARYEYGHGVTRASIIAIWKALTAAQPASGADNG